MPVPRHDREGKAAGRRCRRGWPRATARSTAEAAGVAPSACKWRIGPSVAAARRSARRAVGLGSKEPAAAWVPLRLRGSGVAAGGVGDPDTHGGRLKPESTLGPRVGLRALGVAAGAAASSAGVRGWITTASGALSPAKARRWPKAWAARSGASRRSKARAVGRGNKERSPPASSATRRAARRVGRAVERAPDEGAAAEGGAPAAAGPTAQEEGVALGKIGPSGQHGRRRTVSTADSGGPTVTPVQGGRSSCSDAGYWRCGGCAAHGWAPARRRSARGLRRGRRSGAGGHHAAGPAGG